ncbi:MAG TPA: flagellar hook-associated protein FlgL [Armatimonadota bacterium]|nr:flagellar hook-associated protein FlgL [Armatimonadota bacterium]HPP76421.1 flagellar hook-associated protein FlgL [Armatimonadota bacterium]
MRITHGMLTESVKTNLMNNAKLYMDAQNKSSTGKRIFKPSDDVTGVGRILDYRSAIASIEQFERNCNIGSSQLSTTCSTLDQIIALLQQVWKKSHEAVNDAMTPEAKASMVHELDKLSERLASLANTQHLNAYIFSGTLSNQEAVVPNPAGNPPYIYQGNDTNFSIKIAQGVHIATMVTGDKVFNMNSAAMADVPDVFTAIAVLKDQIESGATADISTHQDDILKLMNNAIGIRSQVGARLKQLEDNEIALADSKLRTKELLSKTEDADLAEAIIELRTRENVYQAAISTANRVLQTTLADFLN